QMPGITGMIQANGDEDPYLRHAGVMALDWIGDVPAILGLAQDKASAVRLSALLALRRLQRSEISVFLHDQDPHIVLEAARAINDQPVNGAMPDLAGLLGSSLVERWLAREPE